MMKPMLKVKDITNHRIIVVFGSYKLQGRVYQRWMDCPTYTSSLTILLSSFLGHLFSIKFCLALHPPIPSMELLPFMGTLFVCCKKLLSWKLSMEPWVLFLVKCCFLLCNGEEKLIIFWQLLGKLMRYKSLHPFS